MTSYVTSESLGTKTQTWIKQIEHYNQHQMELNVGKSALLVIDMQYFFLDPASPSLTCGGSAIIPTLKRLIASFREAERP